MKKMSIGVALIILSMFMLLGFFNADLKQGVSVMLLSLLVAVVLPAAGGLYLIRSYYRERKRIESNRKDIRNETLEAEILKLAGKKDGKLTVVEVMSDLGLSRDTAEELLNAMASNSLAEIELTESGVIVYSFYEVKSLKDKQGARGVLDA